MSWRESVERWIRRLYAALLAGLAISALGSAVVDPRVWVTVAGLAVVCARAARAHISGLDTGLLAAIYIYTLTLSLSTERIPQQDAAVVQGPVWALFLVWVAIAVGAAVVATRTAVVVAVVAAVTHAWIMRDLAPGLWLTDLITGSSHAIGSASITFGLRGAADRADRRAAQALVEFESQVEHVAARAADIETRRMLHDDLVASLSIVRLAGHRSTVAAVADEALDRLQRFDGPADGYSSDLLRTAHGIDVSLQDRRSEQGQALPPAVWTAVCDATNEAIRNVERHARVHRAEIVVEGDDSWIAVSIRDKGVGFSGPVHGFGTSESIVGRLEQVGGRATIESQPGRGTVVQLSWRRGSAEPTSRGATARWVALREASGRATLAMALATPIAQIIGALGLMSRSLGPRPTATLLCGVALVGIVTAILISIVLRGFTRTTSLACVVTTGCGLTLGLTLTSPGSLTSEHGWVVPLVSGTVVVLTGLFAGRLAFALILVGSVTLVAGQALIDPDESLTGSFPVIVLPVVFGTTMRIVGGGVISMGRTVSRINEDRLRATLDTARQVKRVDLLRARLRGLDERTRVLLSRASSRDALGASERLEAEVLMHLLRDEIIAPDVFDDDSRGILENLRRRGVDVQVRTDIDPAAGPVITAVLQALDQQDSFDSLVVSVPVEQPTRPVFTVRPRADRFTVRTPPSRPEVDFVIEHLPEATVVRTVACDRRPVAQVVSPAT